MSALHKEMRTLINTLKGTSLGEKSDLVNKFNGEQVFKTICLEFIFLIRTLERTWRNLTLGISLSREIQNLLAVWWHTFVEMHECQNLNARNEEHSYSTFPFLPLSVIPPFPSHNLLSRHGKKSELEEGQWKARVKVWGAVFNSSKNSLIKVPKLCLNLSFVLNIPLVPSQQYLHNHQHYF